MTMITLSTGRRQIEKKYSFRFNELSYCYKENDLPSK